jgi:hypothetical protein
MKMKYINRTFKKATALLAVLLIGFSSCDETEILSEVPLDVLTTANLYSSVGELQLAIFGLHDSARDDWFT